MAWKKGQLVWLETQGLEPALIIDDREVLQVKILKSGEERGYTKRNPPFKRVQLFEGQKVKILGVAHTIPLQDLRLENELYTFEHHHARHSEADIQELFFSVGVLDLLRQKRFSPLKAFPLRQEAWELLQLREQSHLKGALGCRVQLLPHQLWVVDRALQMPTIRALLADEVGLGKTIEAGLIFSALHARKSIKRVLILVPAALKVQWLMESFRRFNVRFRLDHEDLIEDDDFRDFVITSLEELDKNLTDFDLLIVDEAHRLIHDSEKSAQLAEIVARSRHVLFLSATPKVHGEAEYQRMMQVLAQSSAGEITPLVFQSRRQDLGLKSFRHLEAVLSDNKLAWLTTFLQEKLREQKKVFIVAAKAADVVRLHAELRAKVGEHFALFHEAMDLVERDRQAAYFADPEGARFLLSSEIGGEGRNFQFCHDMVLFDLPPDPLVVEQRIGRLDRLGQSQRVNVWCPVSEADSETFEILRDRYRVFAEPWSGSGLEDEVDLEKSRAVRASLGLPYDGARAEALVQSVRELSEINIRDFLDQLYHLFGLEVEDFDARGNLRIAASSLMFVDYFPGLGESGERVISFDREQALAREDLAFFSIDHPDFVEAVEFLLNSEQGRVVRALRKKSDEEADIQFAGIFRRPDTFVTETVFWSLRQRKILPRKELSELSEGPETQPLFEAVQEHIPQAFGDFLKLKSGWDIDAFLIQF